ncbi:MAG TPA: dTDP-glucose 4,6-dehydratase [bacterium]|nr:dTDP-glucose 4,6-dehydratase [bacterium]
MNIVVTGGAGFIGSHFIRLLVKKYPGYRILNIDKLTYAGNLANLEEIDKHPCYTFMKEDICNKRTMEKVVRGYDAVINFAAESHVDRSIRKPEKFLKTDIMGTFSLLEACRKAGIKKYIQISTDEVYGSIEKGSFTEESPLNPSNPYSASKASADMLTISFGKTYNLPVYIVRSTNNYGPNQHPEKAIPLFITNAFENLLLPIYGNGRQKRDWLYVTDNCRAIDTVLHKGSDGEIYNVSAGSEKENIILAGMILRLTGKPESLIKKVEDRPGHDKRYSISSEKIRKLGWKPEIPFEKGLLITVEWYEKNAGPLKRKMENTRD